MQKRNPARLGGSRTKFAQGYYQVKNPAKYSGNTLPEYRSSWEKDFMVTCDINPAVLEWASEPFSISYQCPIDGKTKQYWVDFAIKYIDADGNVRTQIVEIKPYKQSVMEAARTKRDKQIVLVNQAKWYAAKEFCDSNGLEFVVYTERELYPKRKK